MTHTRTKMTPGPDHPITVEPWRGHIEVRRGSAVIADTDRALELREAAYHGVFYVPVGDVNKDVLRGSEQHTWSPYKGEASYFDLVDVGEEADLPATVWYYDDPFPAVAEIKDHVAFYADRVTVTATPEDGD